MECSKVSVLMASYNHEKYIDKAIESVIAQTYKNWELFIIDDCSQDNSVDIIKKYDDQRIHYQVSEFNCGSIDTFNKLLKCANGDYIAFLGSDDIWEENKLEVQVDFMEKNQKIAVCFSHTTIIDENGKLYLDEIEDINKNIFNQKNSSQGECLRKFFDTGNYLCHPSALLRKSIVEDIGEFDYRFRQLHDYYYWVKVLQKHPVYIMERPLVKYRRVRNNNSVSAGTDKNSIRLLNEIQLITYEMIDEMSQKIFEVAFKDLLKRKIINEIDLICEKYFVLLQWKVMGNNNLYPALSFLNQYINDVEVRKCLAEEYQYSLKCYYEETSKIMKMYPMGFYDEFKEALKTIEEKNQIIIEKDKEILRLNEELKTLFNTLSWKITEPLRRIRRLGKKR